MIRLILNTKCWYSIESFARVRRLTALKVCYRDKLDFLKLRTTLSRSISNRLVYRSQYLRSYKDLRAYYVNLMRGNFTEVLTAKYYPYTVMEADNRKFMAAFSKTKLMKELDYALLWRGVQTNSLFNIAFKVTRKKKKNIYTQRVFFVNPKRRLLFVWKWLNVFIRCLAVKGVPRRFTLIKGFENFLLGSEKTQVIQGFKLQVYKLKLLRAE